MLRFLFPTVFTCAALILAASNGTKPICGDPLFLTPLINAGKLEEAKNRSRADPLKANVSSYSGFLTVDEQFDSNSFFWYFPAEKDPDNAPVLLWLQGGPGTSALSGVFNENGPFYVKLHRGLKHRKYYWSQIAHVIYIDNPIGTGFSFTNSSAGYARDADGAASALYESLLQFFRVFKEIIKNDFHVIGASYGAKYATALASLIDTKNPQALLKISLKGIAIQNGFWDPQNMLKHSDYLYQIGLIDLVGSAQMKQMESKATRLILDRNYLEAFRVFDDMIGGDMSRWRTEFHNLTSFDYYCNLLHSKEDVPYGSYVKYLTKDLVRKAIHVGNLTFQDGMKVEAFQVNEMMKSEKPTMEKLLEKYRVLLYNGQLDIIVTYPSTVNAIEKLRWSGALQYDKQKREQWLVGGTLVGYYKRVKGFTELLVLNAGHKVAYDQPRWALNIIENFISGKIENDYMINGST